MTGPAKDISAQAFRRSGAAILVVALALRILGARGDLSQDEITSLGLALGVGNRPDKLFWAVTVDNNHILNSLWLYIVGAGAPAMAYRALAIATGLGTVLAAGIWGARRSRVAGLVTMGLYAASYLMVGYGSEARGYSGLILCFLLAALAVEDLLAGKGSRTWLALWVLVGCLFHYDMLLSLGILIPWVFWTVLRRDRNPGVALETTIQSFTLPLAAAGIVLAPVLLRGFAMSNTPFGTGLFLFVYNLSLQTAAHLPIPTLHDATLVLALVLGALWGGVAGRKGDPRAALYLLALWLVPALALIFRPPDFAFPRHLLVCDAGFLLLLGDMAGAALLRGGKALVAAMVLLAAIFAGNGVYLARFYAGQRGHYRDAVARMGASGPITYEIEPPALKTIVEFYGHDLGITTTEVPMERWCDGPPEWLILISVGSLAHREPEVTFGPPQCPATYRFQETYPAWGLTGATWYTYKRS